MAIVGFGASAGAPGTPGGTLPSGTSGDLLRFDGTQWGPYSDAGSALVWGATLIPNIVPPSFLRPYDGTVAAAQLEIGISFPWPGIIDSLLVRHNIASAVSMVVPYTLVVNGVFTALTVSLNTNQLGPASNLVDSVAVPADARLLMGALNSGGNPGTIHITVTARFRRT